MPNRILRDWTDSEPVNLLSSDAECLFARLIMKADDFARYTADSKLLRPFLYPRKLEEVTELDIDTWLRECEAAGLIVVYEVEGRKFLRIEKFGQRFRPNRGSKYPDQPTIGREAPQPAADSRDSREKSALFGVVVGVGDGVVRGVEVAEVADAPAPPEENPGGGEPGTPQKKLPGPSDLAKVWNENRGPLPAVRLPLSPDRAKHATARLRQEPDLGEWAAAIQRMAASTFCRGESTDRGWRADFDFALKPATLDRVREGKYDDRGAAPPAGHARSLTPRARPGVPEVASVLLARREGWDPAAFAAEAKRADPEELLAFVRLQVETDPLRTLSPWRDVLEWLEKPERRMTWEQYREPTAAQPAEFVQ